MGHSVTSTSFLGVVIDCSTLKLEEKKEYSNELFSYDECKEYSFINEALNETNEKFNTFLCIMDITPYDYNEYTENLHPFKHTIAIYPLKKKISAEFWGYSRSAVDSGSTDNYQWTQTEKNAVNYMLEKINIPEMNLSLITQVHGG